MSRKLDFKGITLSRTVGIEVEGYTKDYNGLTSRGVMHSSLKRDASLSNSYVYRIDPSRPVGVEVVSKPLANLDMFDDIFEDITSHKWNIGRGSASTHIHVDSSDFVLEDKINMAVFMESLEEVMFLLVKPNRFMNSEGRNRYCSPLDPKWSVFKNKVEEAGVNFNSLSRNNMNGLISAMCSNWTRTMQFDQAIPEYNRYNFVNIFSSPYTTIEFRLFHAIRDSVEAKKFALIAYHILETVKNSTIEQLKFITSSINQSDNADDMVSKFADSIGLNFTPKVYNETLKNMINSRKSLVSVG